MVDDKIKESIQIAEELANEICTGKTSTSPLADKWKKKSPGLYEKIRKQEDLLQDISFHNSIDTEEALRVVHKRIVRPKEKNKIRIIGIAASLLLIIGSMAIWQLLVKDETKGIPEWVSTPPSKPLTSIIDRNKRVIKLSENNLQVRGNQLVGRSIDGKKAIAIELKNSNEFNKLHVPQGGTYQLTLKDKTVVHLNSASELLFPTSFKKHIRQVQLKGEAYFKVEANPESPFYVLLDKLNVQVTGTSFNIKAYEATDHLSITLIEGSINVREGHKLLANLSPGEMFSYSKKTGKFKISQANISATTGWTNDKFIFYNETIGDIMDELSRWYAVEINVSEKIKDLRFSGILSRKQSLTEILNTLNMTNELNFKIYQDRKIDATEKSNPQ